MRAERGAWRVPRSRASCRAAHALEACMHVCVCVRVCGRGNAGKDYVDQLKLIVKTLGPPSEDDLTFITSHKARAYIRALPPSEVRAAGTRRRPSRRRHHARTQWQAGSLAPQAAGSGAQARPW